MRWVPVVYALHRETNGQHRADSFWTLKGGWLISTLVAEAMHLTRGGLVALLSRQRDIDVIAELERGDVVVPVALTLRPDVAVLGIDLPGSDAFTLSRRLEESLPRCRTVLLAQRGSPGELRRAVAAHADAYVPGNASPTFLAETIRRVAHGRKVIDPDLAFAALTAASNPLTPRELDVLRLAAEGAGVGEIAAELYLSVGTVRNYLSRVISKTGARNRVDAIRIADRSGWL